MLVLLFSWSFLLTASLRRQKMSMHISLFTVLAAGTDTYAISLNYKSEFGEFFKANAYRRLWPFRHHSIFPH
jgi:hypothetical protein